MRRLALAGAMVLALVWAGPAAAQMPRAAITGGPNGEVPDNHAEFTFEASGPAPLGAFECRLDGGPWASCASPKGYTKLTGGPHVFAVRLNGPLTDPTPDERRWVVAERTEVAPPPLPPPPPPPPPPDPPGSPDPPDKPKPPRPADPTGKPERRDAFGCAYAANRAGEFHDVILERAAICAINHQRRRRGLRPLRHDRDLHEAAARHAKDMVVRRYFSHVSPRGRTSRDRVERAGYLAGAEFWTLAEVLAWQQAPAGSPADTVRAWMRSRPHRKALLLPSLRDVGVAIVHGTPAGGRGGSTWAANMGRRG